MGKLNNLIENEWFVGIVGGIISGIIVYFLTSYIVERKKKIEHRKNIVLSNNAVLSVLKPHIANSGLPSINQLKAIISSVSRQYGVNTSEMKTIGMFYEDLIFEFVANVYIPNSIKEKNIENLLEKIESFNLMEHNSATDESHSKSKSYAAQKTGAIVGMFATIFSILIGVIVSGLSETDFNIIVVIASVLAILIILICGTIFLFKTHKKDSHFWGYEKVENLKMMNHGMDLESIYDNEMIYTNYFSDEE